MGLLFQGLTMIERRRVHYTYKVLLDIQYFYNIYNKYVTYFIQAQCTLQRNHQLRLCELISMPTTEKL